MPPLVEIEAGSLPENTIMKKTLFITMLTAALLGGNVYANTGFEGGIIRNLLGPHDLAGDNGAHGEKLRIFEDPESNYEALDNVFGYFGVGEDVWVSSGNVVTMEGGIVQTVYGAYTIGTVKEQTIWMKGGTVRGTICGGVSTTDDHNYSWDNTVIVTGGKVGAIIGGQAEAQDDADASRNKVYITGLSADCAPSVCGGKVLAETRNGAGSNEVHLVGDGAAIFIEGERLEGHSMTLGDVQGAYCPRGESGNSVHIYGSGIHARSVNHTQILNFHLVDGLATAEAPVLALSGTDQYWHKFNMAEFSLGIIADDVTDWGVLAGHTVTLVESQLAITGFGSTPYKVVDVTKTGQSASKGILTLGNEGKDLLLKVLRPGTEVLAPGDSRQAGHATITALKENEPGLLDNLTLEADTILGAGRAASLADGLKIQSDADLMIKNMTITANNEIHVGENTITLKDVTIKISDDVCQPVNGIYTIDLRNLINCDLVMENVLLDASDLSLPEGFDPATTSVVFDFGDDVTIKQATGLDMRLGNFWSPSLNLDQQGKVIFTKLVETPEPTTGTLSLLALAALAARRRK